MTSAIHIDRGAWRAAAPIVLRTAQGNHRAGDHLGFGVDLVGAALILEASEQSVPQSFDRADVQRAYDAFIAVATRQTLAPTEPTDRVASDGGALDQVGDPGLEPGTSSLSEKRSNRLS